MTVSRKRPGTYHQRHKADITFVTERKYDRTLKILTIMAKRNEEGMNETWREKD